MYLHVFHREQEWCSGGSSHSHHQIFWIAETMWCLTWFCCWFSSFLQEVFFFTYSHFPLSWKPTIPKSNYTREMVDTKSHRHFMFICYHQNHYFIYLFVIYLLISSCNSSYPSGVAVAQRLAPFGVARFLYADVKKKPENGEAIKYPSLPCGYIFWFHLIYKYLLTHPLGYFRFVL